MFSPLDSWIRQQEDEFCDSLKAISKCKAAFPKCHNEFKGVAHAIANVGVSKSFQKLNIQNVISFFSSQSFMILNS